jgi:lipopolysaccharide/colanic/teichoic acid biosynthesis glycosyltransferase
MGAGAKAKTVTNLLILLSVLWLVVILLSGSMVFYKFIRETMSVAKVKMTTINE